jgi:amidase
MGAKVSGAGYAKANNLRAACKGHLLSLLNQVDVLVCPSMADPPHPVTMESQYGPLREERRPRFQRFTVPFDFSGTPTLSVPCGMNKEGLPLSLQFAGKHLAEPLLCTLGHAYEQATDWHRLHPDV